MKPRQLNAIKEANGLLQRLKTNTGAKTKLGAIGAGIATVASSAVAGAMAGGPEFAAPGAAIGGAYAAYKVTQKNSDFKKTKKVDPTNLVRGAKTMTKTSSSILNALKKRKSVTESEQLDEKRTPKKLGKVLINGLLKKAAAKKHSQDKKTASAKPNKKTPGQKQPKLREDEQIFEDWKDHQKSHKDKAKEYAGKIKALLDEYAQNSSEYDTWDIKDISRRLEDMYESLDNTVQRKKKYRLNMPKAVSEEVEQLDELSKKTLKSYKAKSGRQKTSLAIASYNGDRNALRKEKNRENGKREANDRLKGFMSYKGNNFKSAYNRKTYNAESVEANEEVEQLDELSKNTLKSYLQKASPTSNNRQAGIERANDRKRGAMKNKPKANDNTSTYKRYKATNEEVEQLDELSKKTLGSYIKKASKDASKHATAAQYNYGQNKFRKGAASLDKSEQRQKGISKAADKLTKEETEATPSKKKFSDFLKDKTEA